MAMGASCSKDTGDKQPGEEKLAGNIVGGKYSSASFQKENGVVGLVIRTTDGDGICTGTLISKRLVLTAAHCLEGEVKIIAVIFTKDFNEATEKTLRFATKSKVHKDFGFAESEDASMNDIGLIMLNEDAPNDFKFARLPSIVLAPLKAKTMLVEAGFGKTKASRNAVGDTSGVLKDVSSIELMSIKPDGKEMLLKEDGQGSCNGDSGGPAYMKTPGGKLVQVGINSRGTEFATCIGVGVYTNVAAHLNWIKESSDALMASAD